MKTLPLMVSNSEIQTWKDCRRRWYLSYYRELGPATESVTGARQLGTKIHLALCVMYEEGRNPVEVIIELYQEDERDLVMSGQLHMIDDLRKELDLAKAMLEGYVDWAAEIGLDSEYEMISPEEVIEVSSGLPNVWLRGKLDQRMQRRTDKARLFRDFKTSGSFEQSRPLLYMDEQMRFYHLLEQLHAAYMARVNTDIEQVDGRPQIWRTDGALYLMLRKVKRTARAQPPFYEQIEIRHNKAIIVSTWKRVHKVLEEIWAAHEALDAGADHAYVCPPRPSRDCLWKCDYVKICPLFDDGSNVEGAIAERYVHRDPHERYRREEERKGD